MELNFISCNFFHLLLFKKYGTFAILLCPCVGLVIAYIGFSNCCPNMGTESPELVN